MEISFAIDPPTIVDLGRNGQIWFDPSTRRPFWKILARLVVFLVFLFYLLYED